ncbi:hypothetical protein [Paenibacillus sp. OV219]|uniref:hypothetical protein n=1 Tax=Paenibacillus sp. OV219 TaxID=1884377 RepID=UPI0008C4379E|nr:hypothetical protein [Paenibacillus sp. OV219]SEP14763.1 hypothetical protein SAMN05518847_12010 [Paenibacillus sp. OV219]
MRDEILKNYFYKDGSLRDIYILQTHYFDWHLLLDYFKSHPYFEIFILRDGEEVLERLSIKEILNLKNDFSMSINIVYKGISIFGYFYESDNIEFDITPKEIISLEEVNTVIQFMKEEIDLTETALINPLQTYEKDGMTVPELREIVIYLFALANEEFKMLYHTYFSDFAKRTQGDQLAISRQLPKNN